MEMIERRISDTVSAPIPLTGTVRDLLDQPK